MKKTYLAAALLAATAGSVCANDTFQYEVGAAYNNNEFSNGTRFFGTYYLDPLSNGDGPFAEAAFLNRASSINVSAGRDELDNDLLIGRSVNSWSLGGVYQIQDSDLFVTGSVSRFNGDGIAFFNAGAGYYISDDFAVSGSATVDEEGDYQGAGIAAKKVFDLGVDGFLNLETAYSANENGSDTLSAGVNYYYTPRMSFGIAHSWPDNFGEIGDGATSISIEGFVTESIRISGTYTNTAIGPGDTNGFGLAVSARF